jgi:hypothetical protein
MADPLERADSRGDKYGVEWQVSDACALRINCRGDVFGLVNRAHHCRVCGRTICHACSAQRTIAYTDKGQMKTKPKRVCLNCAATRNPNQTHQTQRENLNAQRNSLVAQRNSLVAETQRDSIMAQRDSLVAERDSLVAQRHSLPSSPTKAQGQPQFQTTKQAQKKYRSHPGRLSNANGTPTTTRVPKGAEVLHTSGYKPERIASIQPVSTYTAAPKAEDEATYRTAGMEAYKTSMVPQKGRILAGGGGGLISPKEPQKDAGAFGEARTLSDSLSDSSRAGASGSTSGAPQYATTHSRSSGSSGSSSINTGTGRSVAVIDYCELKLGKLIAEGGAAVVSTASLAAGLSRCLHILHSLHIMYSLLPSVFEWVCVSAIVRAHLSPSRLM